MKIKKIILSLSTIALTVGCLSGMSHADKAQMQQLVPDVERPRLTEKTYIFSRSQLKYGLQRTNYISRWVDQPLFVDPALDDEEGQTLTYPGFVRMAQISRQYGLDGFAFFPQTSGRDRVYGLAEKAQIPGFHLLNEITSGDWRVDKERIIKLAVNNPQSLRIDGKLVFTSYHTEGKKIEYWQNLFKELRQEYGDQFLFIPDIGRWAGVSMHTWRKKYHANKITPKDVENIKAYLREWISATDGLYYGSAASFQNPDHTFDEDAFRNFLIPIMKSVLAEPQFKSKYFGLSAVVGHENVTRSGVTLSSDATKTLRYSMDAVLDAEPDIIVIPEWDEQNENTSLRPTVYNGLSSMRIMRYYTTKLHNEKLMPLPDDRLQVPNLILSYRKLLIAGEKLKIELLNVPDQEEKTSYSAKIILLDTDGQVVYESKPQQFDSGKLMDYTAIIPSETLSQHKVLLPRVEIDYDGHKSTFQDGLHYIDLRATWNWDYKWIKQSLRDQLQAKSTFTISDENADGTHTVSADFETNEPLARVQVLDNDDVIYEYSPQEGWRENSDHIALSIEWQSMQVLATGLKLSGGITLKNAQGKWSQASGFRNTTYDAIETDGDTLSLDGRISQMSPQRVFLLIPRVQAKDAVLDIKMSGIFEGEIAVRDVLEREIYGIAGTHSFNLVISRYVRQNEMLPLLRADKARFTVPVVPDLPNSVFHLQAIGVSGRTYWSKPAALSPAPLGTETITVFSESKMAPVRATVSRSRVPDIRYIFNPRYGSVLKTDAGRPFWGVLGGYAGLATARGGNDTTPFIYATKESPRPVYPKGAVDSAPVWKALGDGEYALRFDGKGTYVALPQGVISPRSAVTIEIDIKPDSVSGKQMIIANRHHYPGSLSVYIEDGVLKADYGSRFYESVEGLDSGLQLPAGKWSRLIIRHDLENIVFEVDGKTSKKLPAKGQGLYNTTTAVGGFGDGWFAGEIKSLRIRHSVEP